MGATEQDPALQFHLLVQRRLSHNYTQGGLLVNMFIVVFPFKIYPRQKENKDNGPGRNAQFVLVYSTETFS